MEHEAGMSASVAVTCKQCGYELSSLPSSGACPECGAEVAGSLPVRPLADAPGMFVAKLHFGVFVILAAICGQVILMIVGMGIVLMSMGQQPAAAQGSLPLEVIVLSIFGSLMGLGLLYGWWEFTAPDPSDEGVDEQDMPRRLVRGSLCAQALISIAQVIVMFSIGAQSQVFPNSSSGALHWVYWALQPMALIAFAVGFFAGMVYVQRLAPRIPNWRAVKRAKLLMWLGPVLTVFGCGVGQLVALALYWNMLDWIRRDLKGLRTGMVTAHQPIRDYRKARGPRM